MRKALIPLLLLCPLPAFALTPGPEYRVSQPGYGATAETFAAIVAAPGGLIAYTNDLNDLIATPLAYDGTPDVTNRRVVGRRATVVVSHGEPLLFRADGTTIFSGRMNVAQHAVTSGASIRSATCSDAGCLLIFETGLGLNMIATDSEGNAIGSPSPLPKFTAFAAPKVAADPDGFTLLRTDEFRGTSLISRVDRTGKVLWNTTGLSTARDLTWNGDHPLLIEAFESAGQWYLGAATVTTNGTVGSPQPLVKMATFSTPFVFTQRGDTYALVVQNAPNHDLYTVDRAWLSATFERTLNPAPYFPDALVTTPASLLLELRNGNSLGTMGIDPASHPSLLSFGPQFQTPFGIAPSGSNYLLMWLENSTLHAAHMTPAGALLDDVAIANDAFTLQLPVMSVGGDALAVWRDAGSHIRGAVIHPGGTFDPIDLGTLAVRNIVARAADWLVISQSPASATRVTRTGFVDAPKEIPDSPNAVMAAASGGDRTIVDMVESIVVLSHDLDVVRRIPQSVVTFKGDMAFSKGFYLLADGHTVTQLDRDANVVATAPLVTYSTPAVTSTSRGWLVNGTTQVIPGSVLTVSTTTMIGNLSIVARQGDDRVGAFSLHYPGSDLVGSLSSSLLFFRELDVREADRRRAVSRH